MTTLLLAAVLLPALLALLAGLRTPARDLAVRMTPLAPLPALALALVPDGIAPTTVEWLLLGTRIGLDVTGQVFMLFTALLWSLAGAYALAYHRTDRGRNRFCRFFLLTMSGNLGLIAAQDVVTFYLAFAVMTFAAYPLVIHVGGALANRAGRIYVVMAVIGETMLLAGLLLASVNAASLQAGDVAAAVAVSPDRNLIILLLLGGFGIKAGAVPLHVWLPLAHPVAPAAASAVLSGAMIKAGLLGWLRFLPLGEVGLPGWGAALIGFGLLAAFVGVVIGVTQNDAKTALAYSSISQMGLINVAVGIGLAYPAGWETVLAACLVYVVHHGLAKGTLFLGVGVAAAAGQRARSRAGPPWAWRLTIGALGFTGLAVAGAPLTSGMVAKNFLKDLAPLSPATWPAVLDWMLPLTAVGTTLLMGRFLILIVRASRPEAASGASARKRKAAASLTPGLWLPWAVLLAAVVAVVWWVPGWYELDLDPPGIPYPGVLWVTIWPVIAGGILVWLAILSSRRAGAAPDRYRIEAGDLLVPVETFIGTAGRRLAHLAAIETRSLFYWVSRRWYEVQDWVEEDTSFAEMHHVEVRLTRWVVAALAAVFLIIVLFVLLLAP